MKHVAWIFCFPLFFAACEFQNRVPVEITTMNQKQPMGNEKSLDTTVRFDIGSLEITGDKDAASVYSYTLDYDKAGFSPEVRYDAAANGTEGRLSFNLQKTHNSGLNPQKFHNKLLLSFNDSIPLKLKVTAGVGDVRLSLSGLKVSSIDFESGVGEARLSAYEPNPVSCEYIRLKNGVGSLDAVGLGNLNFTELEFEGGVGGAKLDFTGDWKQPATIRIKVGVGGVNIRLPREIGVKVEAEKNFLSGLHLEGFTKQDSSYYSDNYDKASVRVTLDVATGIGGLRVTWL
jgi:hypothetical protein